MITRDLAFGKCGMPTIDRSVRARPYHTPGIWRVESASALPIGTATSLPITRIDMFTRIRPFQTLLALLALTGVLSAQTLTVPNGELNPGESIPVSYSNPAMAGQTVTILVDDGALPTPHKSSFQITLDANGNGTAEWTVPLWELAKFNAPGAPEQTRPIANPEVPSQRNACVMRATYAR